MFAQLRNILKIALRNLGRNKTYAIINILGLSIGIASSILILFWVHDETSYDRFHEKGDRIYRVIINTQGVKSPGTCGALAPTLKNEIPEIAEAVRLWSPSPWQLSYGEKNIRQLGNYADPSFFNIFSFPLLQGDVKTALLDHHSVVLTESAAIGLFGNAGALGKTVLIRNRWDRKEPFVVTGVMRDIPRNSHIQFDFLFSFNLLKQWYRPDFAEQWRNYSFQAYVLLQGNSDIPTIERKMSTCFQKNTGNQQALLLQPLHDVYLNAGIKNHSGGDYEYLRIFTGIAFFILLIACINYMNLATARSARRVKEIALRKVVGAGRRQIVLYQFGESLFFAFLALILALLIIEVVRPVFNSITGAGIDVKYLDPLFLAVVCAIVLITGLLSGWYPAVLLSSSNVVNALKGAGRSGRSASSFRTVLVVLQFMIASIIIIATLVTSDQMSFIKSKNLGFKKDDLVYTWTSGFNTDAIRNELLKNPNVVNVAGSGAQLDWIGWWQNVDIWEGHAGDRSVRFGILEVGYSFLDTYGIELADGRFYSHDFTSDEGEAIVINENAVKAMQMESPVGKTLFFNGVNKRIVGVVKDFHFESLHKDITPLLFVLYPKQLRCLGIRVRHENIATTLQQIKKVIASIEPDYVLEYKFLDEQLNGLYLIEQKRDTLFRVFSFVSIFLSCMGLYGLISYTAEQRTKEIGVRKVLGASVSGIVGMISKDFLKWVVAANVLGWPVAWYAMDKWLQDFAYRIDLTIWPFLSAAALVLAIALLTVSYKVIRASTANPVEALRYE